MKKILKGALILVLCAMFFASCGTTGKSAATEDGAKEEKVAKSDKQAAKEQQKADKQKAKEKKKAGKSAEAKSGSYLVPINEAVAAGEYEDAYALLSQDDNKAYLGSDDIYNMDAGMVKLYANNNEAAISHLEPVADMEKLQEKYAGANKVVVSTFFADEYSQPYVTYDYEDIYAIIFDAVAKLDDPKTADAAFQDLQNIRNMLMAMEVYNETLSAKLNEVGELDKESADSLPKAENFVFNNSALANYLALIYNKYNGDKEGDQRSFFYDQMEESYNQDSYANQEMPKGVAAEKESVPAGKARLNVLAMVGLMAEKQTKEIYVDAPIKFLTSQISENEDIKKANIDASKITSSLGDIFAGNKYKVVYSELKDRSELAGKTCKVTINGTDYELETIENVSDIARKCTERKQNFAARRSLIRNVIKSVPLTVAYMLLPDPAGMGNPLQQKAAEAGRKSAKEKVIDSLSKEYGDIRGAHFYPAEVQALGIDLDPGTYDVVVTFPGQKPINRSVVVKAGQLNLLEVECLK
ncbi:MAG: hypothetical protein J6U56_09100 [Spirochaetia bacterium]|nr:hypothetical protein [Spirochaetia bacterium]